MIARLDTPTRTHPHTYHRNHTGGIGYERADDSGRRDGRVRRAEQHTGWQEERTGTLTAVLGANTAAPLPDEKGQIAAAGADPVRTTGQASQGSSRRLGCRSLPRSQRYSRSTQAERQESQRRDGHDGRSG